MSQHRTHHGYVVGVDGSESAHAAVRWAAQEARLHHVALSIVHVAPAITVVAPTMVWPGGRIPDEVLEIRENDARRVIADAVAEAVGLNGDLEVSTEVFFGAAVPTLVDLSKDARMVVVGSRGTTGRHRRLLGSVSTGLIHHAHGPVAVVHDEVTPAELSGRPVVVGIDGSRASQSALEIAFDEASRRGVDLVAVHAWSDADMTTDYGLEDGVLRRAAEKTLAECLAGWQERYPEVSVHRVISYSSPVAHLLDRAQSAQLVVVGSHGRGGFAGMLLGSVSTAVAQEAVVPVIVVRPR
ncbi:universal stress protein [Mycobacterium sp. WMMD1722]|uniref:universal stress protein n=1 Tax=Mycobacterium sp. WMMD1722 TaxID=3404117 RepID=UPI003BF56883